MQQTATPVERHALGTLLCKLWDNQSTWSQATFGSDSERGPVGALKHLAKEALEAAEAPTDREEYADCLILVMDAARRAGMTVSMLLHAVDKKQTINRGRTWRKPTKADEPIEHIDEERERGIAEREAERLRTLGIDVAGNFLADTEGDPDADPVIAGRIEPHVDLEDLGHKELAIIMSQTSDDICSKCSSWPCCCATMVN